MPPILNFPAAESARCQHAPGDRAADESQRHQQQQIDDRRAARPDGGAEHQPAIARFARLRDRELRALSTVDSVTESSVSPVSGSRSLSATTKASPPSILMALPRSILSTAIRPSPPRSSSARTRSRPARRAFLRRNAQDGRAKGDDRAIEDDQRARRPPLARRTRIGAPAAAGLSPATAARGAASSPARATPPDRATPTNSSTSHARANNASRLWRRSGAARTRSGGGDHECTTARRYRCHARARLQWRPRARPSRIRPAAWRAAAAVRPPGTSPSGCRSRRRIRRSRRAAESSATWRSP